MVKSLSNPVEVVHTGQPSTALVAELQRIGARLDSHQLAASLGHLEATRVTFVTEAIATGILLVAKKASLERGEWQPFCAEIWELIREMGNGVSHFEATPAALHNFTRSLRGYSFLGQHFLSDLEQGHFQPEAADQKVTPPAVKPADVLALDTLPQERRTAVYGAIEQFVAGRSLRRMLIDFRRAENAADMEEVDEANRHRRKVGPAGGSAGAGQMDFYADMLRPIGEIDTLFSTPSFVEKTDRAFWISAADKFTALASKAKKMAEQVK